MRRSVKPEDPALREWVGYVVDALPRDNFVVPAHSSRDFQLLYGPCMQAARFAAACVALDEVGYPHEAAALARSAFEHAVTAHWVYFVKDGIDRFARTISYEQSAFAASMRTYLGIMSDDSAPVVAKGPRLPKFQEIMWHLDASSFLRTTYRNLSLTVHPTHSTVVGYLAVAEGEIQVRQDPEVFTDRFPVIYTCAISSMLAYALIEHLIDPFTARVLVEEQSTSLRLPPFLDDALPSEIRRFPDRWSLPPNRST